MTKKLLLGLSVVVLICAFASAETTVPAGDVSGNWTAAGSPYNVQGEITLPAGQTLTIEPGVTVNFEDHYKFNINGVITAIGEEDRMIEFTAANSGSGWHGLRFLSAEAGSEFSWCWFEFGHAIGLDPNDRRGGALYLENSGITISRCMFWANSAQQGGAIYASNGTLSVENCTFYSNMADDFGAINCVGSGANAEVKNCIAWGNVGASGDISINVTTTYSDIEGGFAGTGNIDEDPLFVNPLYGDYNLQEGSPCIDTGDPNSPFDPDGTITDMGAFYWYHEPLSAPYNLIALLDSTSGDVTLTWQYDEPPPGVIDTLIYDDGLTGTTTSGYQWDGYTMSTRMSPDSPCQLLTLLYSVFVSGTEDDFNAEIYPWAGSQPGTTLLHTENVIANQLDDWTAVDVSDENLMFDGDFNVGFGSINTTTYIRFDSALNNGRSWDYDPTTSTWSTWNEAYLIRAVVEYESGDIAILTPVQVPQTETSVSPSGRTSATREPLNAFDATDDFIEFIIYRNNVELDRTTDTTYVNTLPGVSPFLFTYYVTAWHDEGESYPTNSVDVQWLYLGVEDKGSQSLPTQFALYGAHPNPFNPATTLSFDLPVATSVKLQVFDVNGRQVATVVDGWRSAGSHEVTFDASRLTSGVYLYQIEAGNHTATG